MLYKLGKNFFKFFINFLLTVQIVLIFLSFFTILYWILQIAELQIIEPFAPFFESIKSFVHIFYQRKVQFDEVSVDFSFLIATFIMLILSKTLRIIADALKDLENNYDMIHQKLKGKTEKLFNLILEKEYLAHEKKNNKILFIIKFSISDNSCDHFFTNKKNQISDEIIKEVHSDFCSALKENFDIEIEAVGNTTLIKLNDFDKIDDFIKGIEATSKNLKSKYKEKNLGLTPFMAVETFSNNKDLSEKSEKLMAVVNLNVENKILCLSTFKNRYVITKNPKYEIDSHGVYNIIQKEDVFFLKQLKETRF